MNVHVYVYVYVYASMHVHVSLCMCMCMSMYMYLPGHNSCPPGAKNRKWIFGEKTWSSAPYILGRRGTHLAECLPLGYRGQSPSSSPRKWIFDFWLRGGHELCPGRYICMCIFMCICSICVCTRAYVCATAVKIRVHPPPKQTPPGVLFGFLRRVGGYFLGGVYLWGGVYWGGG